MTPLTIGVLAALGGLACGYIVRQISLTRAQEDQEGKYKELILEAKEEALKLKEEAKKEENDRRKELEKVESQLREREVSIERRMEKIEGEKTELENKQGQLELAKADISKLHEEQEKELSKIANLTKEEARENLLNEVEKDYSEDIIRKIRSMKEQMKSHWDSVAKELIATAVERLATDQTAEMTIFAFHLPSDEIKGKIIGKEGRNIQAFEKATGVDLIVDETPETVLISSFDPIRRAVASKALQMLIKDGRIQPSKIEELVKKAKSQVED